MTYNIAFAVRHLSTGGMPRFVLNSIKYLDKNKYKPFVFEESHAHIDEIRNQILAISEVTHRLCSKDQFMDFVHKYQIDLIHYHDWDALARPMDIPSIETVHTPFDSQGEIGHADLYLLISEHQIPMFQGRNYRFINTFIDNHEFDVTHFNGQRQALRAKFGFNPNEKIIMCIGILAPYKNQAELLKYWDKEIGTLVFVGPLADNFKQYWQPLVENYKSERIQFLGAQKNIPELIYIADVIVNCSAHEGCCLSTLEAASMKKAIVVSDIPQNAKVFKDKKTALVRPVDESFVSAIETLLSNKGYADFLGENAHRMVLEEYSVERFTMMMDEIYDSFLQKKLPACAARNDAAGRSSKALEQERFPLPAKGKKILHITPGSHGTKIEIPPQGWGAIERTISELQKRMRARGYQFDWKHQNEITREFVQQYDFIHCHFWYNAHVLYELGIPYYQTMHSAYALLSNKGEELYHNVEKAIANSIKTVVSSQQEFEHWSHLAGKMIKIPYGVDTEFFCPSQGDFKDFLLCVGRIEERKAFHLAVEAAKEMDMEIVIVGPEDSGIELLKASLERHAKAQYLGAQNIEMVRNLMQQARALILPSRAETMGLVVMEAMSCGIPVIATTTCCHDFNTEGLLRCEQTATSIAMCIEEIIGKEKEFGESNRNFIEQYSWERIVDDYIKLLYVDDVRLQGMPMATQKTEKLGLLENQQGWKVDFDSEGVILRVAPQSSSHNYHFIVYKNGILSYETEITSRPDVEVWARGLGPKFYTDYEYKVWIDGVLAEEEKFSLKDKDILIEISSSAIGDNLAWMPYIIEFQKKHKCRLTVCTAHASLFKNFIPDITFCHEKPDVNFYFTYTIGVFDNENERPISWRDIPLQKVASDILGLPFEEKKLDLRVLANQRSIQEKYVCIAPRSTMKCKEWNYQLNRGIEAWQTVVDWLVKEGYKVVWISKEECFLENVIDKSGNLTLTDRITDLTFADFYIGLPAGLSWLAYYCGTHTFMITGFSRNWCEFQENVTRIYKEDVCRGCFNEERYDFTRAWDWCPCEKQFQCTRLISPDDVISAISKWISGVNRAQCPTGTDKTSGTSGACGTSWRSMASSEGKSPSEALDPLYPLHVESLKTEIHAKLLYWIVRELNPLYAVELGAYKGFVTIHIAKALQDGTKDGKLFTIDAFKQQYQHQLHLQSSRAKLEQNLKKAGVEEVVTILEGDTHQRIHEVPDDLDFCFIDADHTYKGVLLDFTNCWSKLRQGGIIAMHDTNLDDVTRVIDEEIIGKHRFIRFLKDEGLILIQKGSDDECKP